MGSFQGHFPYRPLAEEIRLLTVQPGAFETPLVCSLAHENREAKPSYTVICLGKPARDYQYFY